MLLAYKKLLEEFAASKTACDPSIRCLLEEAQKVQGDMERHIAGTFQCFSTLCDELLNLLPTATESGCDPTKMFLDIVQRIRVFEANWGDWAVLSNPYEALLTLLARPIRLASPAVFHPPLIVPHRFSQYNRVDNYNPFLEAAMKYVDSDPRALKYNSLPSSPHKTHPLFIDSTTVTNFFFT